MAASFRLRRVLSRADTFEPLTEAELDRLVHVIGLELDAIAHARGDVPADASTRAELGLRDPYTGSVISLDAAPSGRVDIG